MEQLSEPVGEPADAVRRTQESSTTSRAGRNVPATCGCLSPLCRTVCCSLALGAHFAPAAGGAGGGCAGCGGRQRNAWSAGSRRYASFGSAPGADDRHAAHSRKRSGTPPSRSASSSAATSARRAWQRCWRAGEALGELEGGDAAVDMKAPGPGASVRSCVKIPYFARAAAKLLDQLERKKKKKNAAPHKV